MSPRHHSLDDDSLKRLAAFSRLQDALALTPRAAAAWVRRVRAERRADDRRRESRRLRAELLAESGE